MAKKKYVEVIAKPHPVLLERYERDLRRLSHPPLTEAQIQKELKDIIMYECHEKDGPNHVQLRLSVQDETICARFYDELGIGRKEKTEKMYTMNVRTKISAVTKRRAA